jgi:glycosyltransferase involved in cell wall biosynthesis
MINDQFCQPQQRLLVLSQTAPEAVHHGIGLRAYHLLRNLPRGYQVSCLSAEKYGTSGLSSASSLRRLRSCCRMQSPYRFEPELQRAFDKMLRDHAFDAVLVMGVDLLQYTEHCAVPVIADLVDEPVLAALRQIRVHGFSPDALRMAKHIFELLPYLRRNCRKAQHCILVSQKDADWLRSIVPGAAVSVVPNGVDADYFCPAGRPVNPREVVFSGIMGFPPNIAAAQYFAVPGWAYVRVTGFVPDLRPNLEQAAVIVSPLVSGGGMKNKILEAWAMGKAVIATPLGCAGISVHDGVDLLVARNADEFASKTVHLLNHPEEARRLGRCAQQTVATNYSWSDKARLLDRILRDVTGSAYSPPGCEYGTAAQEARP